MPSSIGSSIFIFAAVLSSLNSLAAAIVAFLALLLEAFFFYTAGNVRIKVNPSPVAPPPVA